MNISHWFQNIPIVQEFTRGDAGYVIGPLFMVLLPLVVIFALYLVIKRCYDGMEAKYNYNPLNWSNCLLHCFNGTIFFFMFMFGLFGIGPSGGFWGGSAPMAGCPWTCWTVLTIIFCIPTWLTYMEIKNLKDSLLINIFLGLIGLIIGVFVFIFVVWGGSGYHNKH
jgi:hypothetical protein